MSGAELTVQRLVPRGEAIPAEGLTRRASFDGARLAEATFRLQPRGVGQILDSALDVFARHFLLCVGIALLVQLPVQLGSELVLTSGVEWLNFAWNFVGLPAQLLTTAFVCSVVGRDLIGMPLLPGEALSRAFRRLPGISIILGSTAVAAGVGVCVFCVGTYFVQWVFSVATAAYVLEEAVDRANPRLFSWARLEQLLRESFGAMGRSFRLTTGWPFLGRWLGWFVVGSLLTSPFVALPAGLREPTLRGALLEYVPAGPATFLLAALGAVFVAIATAFLAVLMTVYYVDCRVRKEGLDIERQLAVIRLRSARAKA